MVEMACYGNMASKSDMQVGAKLLEVGIWGAYQNVLINLADVTDATYRQTISAEAAEMHRAAEANSKQVLEILDGRAVPAVA